MKINCFVLFVLFCSLAYSNNEKFDDLYVKAKANLVFNLKKALNTHANSKMIDWLNEEAVVFLQKPVELKMLNHVMPKPSVDLLKGFTTESSKKKVQTFLQKHEKCFLKAWQRDQVPSTIVAGILFIETAFGADHVVYFNALSTLLSLALLRDKNVIDYFVQDWINQAKKHRAPKKWRQKKAWIERANDVGEKWFEELKSMFLLAQKLHWNKKFMMKIEGSWAGAIGFSQFMPSTALKKMQERDFDLWSWCDSISFTSHELDQTGWGQNPDRALLGYNRVEWYRKTVFEIHLQNFREWESSRGALLYQTSKTEKTK